MPNRRKGFVLGGATLAGLACLAAALEERLPPGVSAVLYELAVPPAAAPTPDRVALGDKLFNDKRLSVNDRVSCATCHDPARGFVAGDEKGICAAAKRGWGLFNGKGRCNSCHAFSTVSPLFSDQKFHNIGIAAHKTDFIDLARKAAATVRAGDLKQVDELAIQTHFSELGRFLVTKQTNDIGAFKTPGLRNVAITAPYMHDGSLATLWDVMDHYNKGGVPNPNLDGGMQRLGLTEAEIDDLVAFLESLTPTKFAARAKQEIARQRARKSVRPERETAVAMGKQGHLGDLAPTPDPARPAAFGVLVRGGTSYE